MDDDILTLQVTQPERPLSINETAGQHWAKVNGSKKAWQEAAFWSWKEQRSGPVGMAAGSPADVLIELGFHNERTRDPHNYAGTVCKWMIDGLVLAGVWPDDNPQWVSLKEPVLVVHSRVPSTTPLICKIHFRPKETT